MPVSLANEFLSMAIQDWGQPEEQRIAAVQALLDAAGFDAKAECSPVFGGIWPKQCSGPHRELATAWLNELTDTMPRGKFEIELAHIEKFIAARAQPE